MSFPRYPSYKDSGVEWLGEVPEGWNVSKIKFCSYVKGRVGWHGLSSNEFTDEGVHLVTGTDFKGGFVDWESCYRIDEKRYNEDPYIQLRENDLLITKDGSIGKLARVKQLPERASLNSGIFLVRSLGLSYHDDYLYWVLQSVVFSHFLDLHKTGSTIQHLYQEVFNRFAFTIPSNSEQNGISSFLDREADKIDALVAEQENLIALLKEKRQAVISHAVTKGLDPTVPMKDSEIEWLGEVPENWAVIKLTKCVESIIDYRGKTPTKVDDGVFLVTARNIRDGRIDYDVSQEFVSESEYEEIMRRGLPKLGDLLLTMEAPLGQVANIDRPDVAIAQRIIKLDGIPRSTNNYFLKWWIMGTYSQSQLASLATGSTALGLKASKLGQLDVCLPPKPEQEGIINFLNTETAKLDTLTAEAHRAIDLLKERRSALISAAVTGKIDVRGYHAQPQPII